MPATPTHQRRWHTSDADTPATPANQWRCHRRSLAEKPTSIPSSYRPLPQKSELEEYLQSPPEKLNNELFDILKWWSDKCTTYKVLASMAKDILAIPVSTVASESAFSTSGRVIDDFRSSLGVKTVEALICTQDWLRGSNVCIDLEQLLDDVEIYEKDIADTIEGISGLNLS